MGSSLARAIAALETMDAVIARLAGDRERNEVIARLLVAIEQDKARLLAEISRAEKAGSEPLRFAGTSPASGL